MEVSNENDILSLYGEGDTQENLLICQWTDKYLSIFLTGLHFKIVQSISNSKSPYVYSKQVDF